MSSVGLAPGAETRGEPVRARISPLAPASLEAQAGQIDASAPDAQAAEPGVEDAYRTFWSDLGIFLVIIVLSVLIARAQGLA